MLTSSREGGIYNSRIIVIVFVSDILINFQMAMPNFLLRDLLILTQNRSEVLTKSLNEFSQTLILKGGGGREEKINSIKGNNCRGGGRLPKRVR